MTKKNLPALPSAQKKSKKFTPVAFTEEETDLHTQKERELEKLKADQSELAGITEQLNSYKQDPLTMLTQRKTVSALEQRAAEITGKYGSRSALDTAVSELSRQVNDPKLKYLNSSDYRSRYQRLLDLGSGGQSVQNNFKEMGLEYLTPEERGRYNYYYYKHGKNKADKYLSGIQYDINSRWAEKILEGTNEEDNGAADVASKLMLAYKAGLNSAQRGGQHFMAMLAGEDTHSVPSAVQMASAQAREQMREKGTIALGAYDVAQNIGYETPAILATTVLGAAGKALLVDDAIRAGKALMKAGEYLGTGMLTIPNVGSSYQDALNQGYTKEQAQTKAATAGIVEVAKNVLYNKFGKLGGAAAEKAVQTLDGKINNAATRIIAKFGAKGFLGFTGEYIQNIVDKAADNALLGTDHNIELFSEEAFYESMVEAISGLITEGSVGVFEKANGIPSNQMIADFINEKRHLLPEFSSKRPMALLIFPSIANP